MQPENILFHYPEYNTKLRKNMKIPLFETEIINKFSRKWKKTKIYLWELNKISNIEAKFCAFGSKNQRIFENFEEILNKNSMEKF